MTDYATTADGRYAAQMARAAAYMADEPTTEAHHPMLVTNLHPRAGRPIGRLMFRHACSCGWRGEWQTTAGLAHSAHDAHKENGR